MWNDNNKLMTILDDISKKKMHFPCRCPVCNNCSTHIYIHKHDKNHCGLWIWCSSCGSYSHMSAKTPTWCKNLDYIDESKLCAQPDYLDKMSDNIDILANEIIPVEKSIFDNSFVMEDRFKVKFKSDFDDVPKGTIGFIIIRNDFKKITIDFIDSENNIKNLNISAEEAEKIFEVIK